MGTGSETEGGGGPTRRLLGRLFTRQKRPVGPGGPRTAQPVEGCVPIRSCGDREIVKVTGTLRTVTLRARAGVPSLEAELSDGSASLDVVWLGRREIAGIEPGRALVASGRVAISHGRPVLFNPTYELRPPGQE